MMVNDQIEVIAICPHCKTIESIRINGGHMEQTSHFQQKDGGPIYHLCGSSLPCRLLSAYRIKIH